MNSIFGRQNQNGFVQPNQPSPFAAFVTNFMQKFPNMNPEQIGMQLLNSDTSDQPILMQNANIRITRPDLYLSR